ncbi:short chain dehydrogenase reductase [Xylaria sp. FL0933]|nr:short chain dehydrogenase reductase [Xylaria sp. FL0933]
MSDRQIALITGANGALGKAIAESLAKDHGYHVIISSRDPSAGVAVASALSSQGFSTSSVQLDLESDESISKVVSSIQSQHGKLDILVNNAGVNLEYIKPAEPLTPRETFTKTFQTNVIGPALLTDALLPLLKKAECPRVVFVSSNQASINKSLDKSWYLYGLDIPAYKTSKAAVNMLAVTFSVKLEAMGGMCNSVCLAGVNSKMSGFNKAAATPEDAAKKVVEMATLPKGGRTGTFEDAQGTFPW